jgi:excisionase family DNA binding protein
VDEVADEWLSVGDAARAVGVSRTTLLAAEEAGLLAPARTPGGHRRYRPDDLQRYLEACGTEAALTPTAPAVRLARASDPAVTTDPVDPTGLAAAVRAAVRPLARALDADCAGLYLARGAELGFCAAFGVPRWLVQRLIDTAAPPPVVRALTSGRPQHFDPTTVAFPEPRAAGHGLAVALSRPGHGLGVLFVLTAPDRELLAGELRIIDAFGELLATVVEERRRIADLEARLARIAAVAAG